MPQVGDTALSVRIVGSVPKANVSDSSSGAGLSQQPRQACCVNLLPHGSSKIFGSPFNQFFIFLFLNCWRSLHSLDTSPLLDTHFVHVFSTSVTRLPLSYWCPWKELGQGGVTIRFVQTTELLWLVCGERIAEAEGRWGD